MTRVRAVSGSVSLIVLLALWNVWSTPGAPESRAGAAACLVLAGGIAIGALAGRWNPALIGLGVTTVVAIEFGLDWPESLRDNPLSPPLGYANANGALLVAAAGGVAVAVRSRGLALRVLGALAVVGIGGVCWVIEAQASAVAAAALACWVVVAPYGSWKVWTAVGGLGLAVPAGLPVVWSIGLPVPGSVVSLLSQERIDLWDEATALLRTHPVRGVGPGSFSSHSPTAADADLAWAHSYALQAAAELGLVGLLLLTLAVAWTAVMLGRDAPLLATLLLPASVDYVLHFGWVLGGVSLVLGAALVSGSGKPWLTPPSP